MWVAAVMAMLVFMSLSAAGALIESAGTDELRSMGVEREPGNTDLGQHFI